MDYEKLYKEAVERARTLLTNEVAADIFPELKNDDEKIKKGLFKLLNCIAMQEYENTFGITKGEALAWLEKQNEQKSTLPKWKYKKDNAPLLRDSLILNKYGCVAKSPSGALVSDVWVIDYDELAKLPKEEFEKQNEHEPADKVEPKFHEGNWIVNKGHSYLIAYIDYEQRKYLFEIGGYTHEQLNWEYIENADKRYHRWTIQDAKDGDVLYMDNGLSTCTFIYKSIDNVIIQKYASYNKFGFEGTTYLVLNDGYVIPATKEQRDTLIKAMTDAGYTFDFEKKELKKIEYKPTEWEPQTGDTFRKKGTTSPTYHLCDKLEDGITFDFVENSEVGISGGEITIFTLKQDYELVERLKSIEDVAEEELNKALQTKVEQKPAWSKEDEKLINSIIELIDNGALDRDEKDYFIEKLKSLRPKSHWKPSGEQMKVLDEVIRNPHLSTAEYNGLIALREQLKAL